MLSYGLFIDSIWGLICVMSSAEIQQIKDLMEENAKLKNELLTLKQSLLVKTTDGFSIDKRLQLTPDEEFNYYNMVEDNNLKTSLTPFLTGSLNPEYKSWLITITFSPKLFPLICPSTAQQQKHYILYHLLKMKEIGLYQYAYGCTEYFKTGIVHAHVVIQTYDGINLIKEYLNEEFNHSKKNTKCIDIKPAHITAAIKYVNKELEGGKERGDLFFSIGEGKHYLTKYIEQPIVQTLDQKYEIAKQYLSKPLPIPQYKNI